jgi:Fuc2NAc and GlcNAc transferase
MIPLLAAAAATLGSWALTGAIRRFALARALLDIPNERSAHTVPTPRGGGLAIAAVVIPGVAVLAVLDWISNELATAMIGGGALLTGVGWLDDCRNLGVGPRLSAQSVAAVWALVWIGGFPSIDVGFAVVDLGMIGTALAAAGLVWLINLYNFMDGIDGLAAGQAVAVGLFGGSLLLVVGHTGLATVAFAIAATSGGFLAWNWRPAKIFLGDAGSGFLGYLLGVLALASEQEGALPLLVWLLLLAVFIFDATVTLFRRVLTGEKWYVAHRSHAYQRAVQAGWRHDQVSTAVLLMTAGLAGLACLAVRYPVWLPLAVLSGLGALAGVYVIIERLRPMR